MNDLLRRRRAMMEKKAETEELYPIGTDICDYYDFKSIGQVGKTIDSATGEIVSISGTSQKTSENYAEINPKYTYAKKYYRLYYIAFYDKSYAFIKTTAQLNNVTDGAVLANIPKNARYVRIAMYNARVSEEERVGLVRIA